VNSSISSGFSPDHFAPINHNSYSYHHYGPNGVEGVLQILPLSHSRALQTGLSLLAKRPLVLFGISLGNSFFTRKRIEIAICGMAQLFGEVNIVIPDSISTHTLRALGYEESEIYSKIKKESRATKSRCLRAMERAISDNPSANIQFLDWERDIASLPGYWDAYSRVCQLFNTNQRFQKDVLDKGQSVLKSKRPDQPIKAPEVRECIEYLLKEFAYLSLCRNASGRDLVIPYHQDFALGHAFCDGEYDKPLPGVGWLIFDITLTDENPAPTHQDADQKFSAV